MKRASGEGSVFFNKRTRRWNAIGPAPRRLIRTGTTQAEAIRRLRAALGPNIAHVSGKQPLAHYLTDWLSTKAADVSARTHDGYQTIITLHITPHIGTVTLANLKPQHIQRVLDVQPSPWVRRATFQLLNAALELAADWEVIARNPCRKVSAPAIPDRPAAPLFEEQFYAFLDAIRGDRLHALWLLLVAVGPRRGEALALAKGNLNLEAGTVTFMRSLQRVRGKLVLLPVKTKKGNRTPKLPAPLPEALRAHLKKQKEERLKAGELWQEHDLVFTTRYGTPLEPRNVSRRFHQILAGAGIASTKLHTLRHTAISVLLREGVDLYSVQTMAGHARASTTSDTYGHVMTTADVAANKMAEVLARRK